MDRCWLKTTTLAEGGHQLRMEILISLERLLPFSLKINELQNFSFLGFWHGSCFVLCRIGLFYLGFSK